MSDSSHPTLDAAAFEVLREVARQEDSVLLRVPVARGRGVELWMGRDPVSAGATFLSSAERHLLEVHRDEVAAWMRLAAFQGLFEDPQRAGLMARELDSKRLIELPGQAALATQATDLLRAADPRCLPIEAQPILRRASAWPNSRPQDPWTLAALSLRLVPHPVPQQWFAFRALERGQTSSVRRFLSEWSSASSTTNVRTHSERTMLELRGSLAFACSEWTEAARNYRAAASSAVGLRLNALWWALNAAQSGDRDVLRAASELFHSQGPLSNELRASAESTFRLATAASGWRPTAAFRHVATTLEGQFGGLLKSWCS
ncbi:MAG: hypothetical protein GC161_16540 [Planctomycetaceae bacterium]|nr:hypothetical protein [Planctomycetaceae bacterium]